MNCRFFGACFSLFETQKQGQISKTGFVLESFLNKSGADAPVAYSATFATAPSGQAAEMRKERRT